MKQVMPPLAVLRVIAQTPEGRELLEGWVAILRTNCDRMKAELDMHIVDYEQTISTLRAALGDLH